MIARPIMSARRETLAPAFFEVAVAGRFIFLDIVCLLIVFAELTWLALCTWIRLKLSIESVCAVLDTPFRTGGCALFQERWLQPGRHAA